MPLAPKAPDVHTERPKAAYCHPLPHQRLSEETFGYSSVGFSARCSPSMCLVCRRSSGLLGICSPKTHRQLVGNTCNISWNFALGAKCGVPMDYIVFA